MPFLRGGGEEVYYSWTPSGDVDGPTVLFIHGLGSSNSFYASIIPRLVQNGYSCLAFDTPGRHFTVLPLQIEMNEWRSDPSS